MRKLQLISYLYGLILGGSSIAFAGPGCTSDLDCQDWSDEICCRGVCLPREACYGATEKKPGKHGR